MVGVSAAYHLAKKGKDVLLLEKSELTAGSTWHAAGLITLYHPTPNVKQIHWDSINMYSRLEGETGQQVGFHQPGSLRLGTSTARMDEFKYAKSKQGHKSSPMAMLSQEEVADMVPILNMDGIYGGLFTPGEGHIDPYSLTQAIAIGARKYGAELVQHAEVTAMVPRGDGGWDVVTPHGTVTANRVINATGFWGREVGALCGMDVPLVPVQHQYLVTKSVPAVQALKKEIPVLRHLEGSFYLRQERDGLLIGPYESSASMVQCEEWARDKVTPNFGKELFQGDLERLSPHLEVAMEAFPCFQDAEILTVVNGAITYTPDILPMVGPTLAPNMWMAVGFGYGIAHAGGVGKYLAEWICNGEAPYELLEFDPLRYGKWTNLEYTIAKTRESYGYNTALSYPNEERFAGRPTARVNPIYNLLVSRGAHMGFHAGWEQPDYFAAPGTTPEYQPSFSRVNWQLDQAREYKVIMEKVGVVDLTPFAKLMVTGAGARAFLDRAQAGTVPKQGRTSLGHMLTPAGKVYAELTITCLGDEKFLVVTGSGSEFHDQRQLQIIATEEKFDVNIDNVTEDMSVLSVVGPLAGDLMARITDVDMGQWKFLDAKECKIGGVDCMAVRISYTGELGWEIYTGMDNTTELYNAIIGQGGDLGLQDVGTRVINTLRIEKGFRAWGSEMNKDTYPIEAGLMPFVRMKKKAPFIGKAAISSLLQQSYSPKHLVFLSLQSDLNDPEGDETVYCYGKAVGNTTSGCYSPALSSSLAMAYVPSFLSVPGSVVQVDLHGVLHDAKVLEGPPALTQSAREAKAKKEEEKKRLAAQQANA